MIEAKITGLNIIRAPKTNVMGNTPVAYFDCEANGFALTGCVLVKTEKGGATFWPPKIETPDGLRRSIKIIDNSLHNAIRLAAREAYRIMGGAEMPEPLHPHRGCDEEGWPTHPLHPNYSPLDRGGRAPLQFPVPPPVRREKTDGDDREGLETFLKSTKPD